ncbi:coiled-coil domain-containing protein [Paenibacillus hexagrammi]|uniref:Uncharacterized protein n=1 Tax=Paenibacillus hexagrammi TaxID=2908839 RepID=A0ABY3SU16_9BACL|nr:hypothetical protein [Paenibacillus sp. YPD9-1]UJF36565.1 hypothetical protein L0M14_30725 [Paenibacillus sp. YPD9-1]
MAQKSFNHISEETKIRINEAIEASALTDKEWIDRAVEVWALHAMKTEIPDFRKEIEEVEGLTNRIRNVLVNLAQRTAFEKDEVRRKWEEVVEEKRLEIEKLNSYQSQLEKDLKAATEETQRQKEIREEAEKYAKSAQESSEGQKALAESYKEKNDTLAGLVTEYKAGYEESRTLREQVAELGRDKRDLERQLFDEKENTDALARIGDERVRQLEEKHKADLERIEERKEIEKERALIHLRTELQEVSARAAQKATDEIKGLYSRIEQLRGEHDQAVEYLRKDHEKRIEAMAAQMEAMRADYERQIADLKNPPKK